jgi:hypothetical protein
MRGDRHGAVLIIHGGHRRSRAGWRRTSLAALPIDSDNRPFAIDEYAVEVDRAALLESDDVTVGKVKLAHRFRPFGFGGANGTAAGSSMRSA